MKYTYDQRANLLAIGKTEGEIDAQELLFTVGKRVLETAALPPDQTSAEAAAIYDKFVDNCPFVFPRLAA
jgi:hypothetical protein